MVLLWVIRGLLDGPGWSQRIVGMRVGGPAVPNNLGELNAVLELLKATAQAGLADEELHILADSQYAINVISKWSPGWKKRGWVKADKETH